MRKRHRQTSVFYRKQFVLSYFNRRNHEQNDDEKEEEEEQQQQQQQQSINLVYRHISVASDAI